MSGKLYERPPDTEHPHLGPLECNLSEFSLFLKSKGYSAATLSGKLRFTCHFSHWLGERALNVSDVDDLTINLFIKEPPKTVHIRPGDFITLCSLLEFLRKMELIPLPQALNSKPCGVESEFALYLKEERGLSQKTVDRYMPIISSFLSGYSSSDPIILSKINI